MISDVNIYVIQNMNLALPQHSNTTQALLAPLDHDDADLFRIFDHLIGLGTQMSIVIIKPKAARQR